MVNNRFICISEFGVSPGRMIDAVTHNRQLRQQMTTQIAGAEARGEGPPQGIGDGHCLELITFEETDQVNLHIVPDLRFLGMANYTAPVNHQRASGCSLLSAGEVASIEDPAGLLMSPEELLHGDPLAPFHAVYYLKLAPALSYLLGDLLPGAVLTRLPTLVHQQFQLLNDRLDQWLDQQGVDAPRIAPGDHTLQLMLLRGLDAPELVLVTRVSRLEALCRLERVVASLVIGDVLDIEPLRARLDELRADRSISPLCQALGLDASADQAYELVERSPLLIYTKGIVGVPFAYLIAAMARDQIHSPAWIKEEICSRWPEETLLPPEACPDMDALACTEGSVKVRLQPSPGHLDKLAGELEQLESTLSRTDWAPARPGTPPSDAPSPGSTHYFNQPGVANRLVASAIGAEGDTSSSVRPLKVGTMLELLGREPSRGVLSSRQTIIPIRALPPGFPLSRLDRVEQGRGLNDALAQALERARQNWVGWRKPDNTEINSIYNALKQEASRASWSYARTNAALGLCSSIISLLFTPERMTAYLDLAEPLFEWIQRSVHRPEHFLDQGQGNHYLIQLDRLYKHLDRLMHARSHRYNPMRQPGVSLAFEAKAGYVTPRDCFMAYLREVHQARGGELNTPLLVDGADPALKVKHALKTGMYYMSALRLSQPVVWPTIAHEVEHVRLMYRILRPAEERVFLDWLAYLGQTAPGGEVIQACDPGSSHRFHFRLVVIAQALGRLRLLSAGQKTWTPWNTLGVVASQLSEVICDLGVLDSPVLGGPATPDSLRMRRFYATMWPNLSMELNERFNEDLTHAQAQHGRAGAINLLETLGMQFLCRLSSVAVMLEEPGGDRAMFRRRLESYLQSGAGIAPVQALLTETARNNRETASAADAGLGLDLQDAVSQTAHRSNAFLKRLCAHEQAGRCWAGVLELLNRMRLIQRTLPPGPSAIKPMLRFLDEMTGPCGDEISWERGTPPWFHLDPRDGITPGSESGQRQAEHIAQLYFDMQPRVCHWRARALQLLLTATPADLKER